MSTILVHAVGGNEYHQGKACAAKWVAAQGNMRDELIATGLQPIGGDTEECKENFNAGT